MSDIKEVTWYQATFTKAQLKYIKTLIGKHSINDRKHGFDLTDAEARGMSEFFQQAGRIVDE